MHRTAAPETLTAPLPCSGGCGVVYVRVVCGLISSSPSSSLDNLCVFGTGMRFAVALATFQNLEAILPCSGPDDFSTDLPRAGSSGSSGSCVWLSPSSGDVHGPGMLRFAVALRHLKNLEARSCACSASLDGDVSYLGLVGLPAISVWLALLVRFVVAFATFRNSEAPLLGQVRPSTTTSSTSTSATLRTTTTSALVPLALGTFADSVWPRLCRLRLLGEPVLLSLLRRFKTLRQPHPVQAPSALATPLTIVWVAPSLAATLLATSSLAAPLFPSL